MLSSLSAVRSTKIAPKPVLTALALCLSVGLAGCTNNTGAATGYPAMTCDHVATQGHAAPVDGVAGTQLDAPELNTPRLFDQPIGRLDHRFDRIEHEVQRLRDDFDRAAPAIGRLMGMERDLAHLIEDLDDMAGQTSRHSDTQAADAPPLRLDRMYTPEATGRATAASETATVSAVRFGEHADRSRIVMDLSGETDFSVALQENHMGMRVTLPAAAWEANQNWQSDIAPLIRSYRAEPLGSGGYQVIFTFHEPAHLVRQEILPPRAHRGHGLVIDLFNPNLHEG